MAESARISNNELSKNDVDRIRARLIAMRAELDARRSSRDLLQLKRVEVALAKLTRGGYGNCEPVTGRLLEPDIAFERFHREKSAEQRAHDGFAPDEIGGVVKMLHRQLRILQPIEEFRSQRAPGERGGEGRPAQRIRQ